MKNRILVVCMILVSLATTKPGYAKNGGDDKASTFETVITDFMDSFMNSDYKKLDRVLGDNACVKIPRMEKVIVQNRSSLIERMREDSGVKQACTCNYQVIAQSDAIVIARVDFQYTNFKQQNFIVMERDENKKWKITEVCKLSQNTTPKNTAPPNVVAVNR